jgi:hypothetical protein
MVRIRRVLVVSILLTLGLSWSLMAEETAPAPNPPAEEIGAAPAQGEPSLLTDPETGGEEIFLGPCSASLDCGDGNVISCTGSNTCTASDFGGYVECDGQRTYCPNRCTVSLFCSCECRSGTIFCSSNSGNCQKSGGSITCDGFTITCDRFCSRPCFPRIP